MTWEPKWKKRPRKKAVATYGKAKKANYGKKTVNERRV